MKIQDCPHQPPTEHAAVATTCQECGARSSLRTCTTCGHVGCCESQQGHNTEHAKRAGHPIIRALVPEGQEGFLWCYECRAYLRP